MTDAKAFDGFVAWLQALYAAELPHFIDANFNSPLDLLRSPGAALKLIGLGGFGKLGPAIERRFRDVHTVSQQIQSRTAHFAAAGAVMLGNAPETFL